MMNYKLSDFLDNRFTDYLLIVIVILFLLGASEFGKKENEKIKNEHYIHNKR